MICAYNGDRGIHTVQVSENVNVSTSLDGESFLKSPND